MKIWKNVTIPEYKDLYLVSNEGDVYSVKGNKCLKPILTRAGYYRVHLANNGNIKTIPVHRLVALAFIDNIENKPTVNHINEIKTDNRAENLEWATIKEQNIHGTRIQRAVSHTDWKLRSSKMDYSIIASKHEYQKQNMCNRHKTVVYKAGQVVGIFNSQAQAAEFAGVSEGKVSQCIAGAKTSCKGYTFKRLED